VGHRQLQIPDALTKIIPWGVDVLMKRFDLSRLNAIVVPLLAGVLGMLVGAVMLLALGANPLDA
jgi:hypothetical protein